MLQADGSLYGPAMRAVQELREGFKNSYGLQSSPDGYMDGCVDVMSGSSCMRYIFEQGQLRSEDFVIDDLMDVLKSGCKQAFRPGAQENTCIIFSGHGSGVLTPVWEPKAERWLHEPDVGDSAFTRYCQQQETAFWEQVMQRTDSDQKSIFLHPHAKHLFSSNQLKELMSWLCHEHLAKKIDFIGFDACSMALLEVASGLRDDGRYLIASQAPEEKEGWGYGLLLQILASEKDCAQIVRKVVYGYEAAQRARFQPRYSLSAWDLSAAADLNAALDRVVDSIANGQKAMSGIMELLMAARYKSVPLWERLPYADLGILLEHILREIDSLKESSEQCALRKALINAGEKLKVMILASVCSQEELLTGCSIYFPQALIDRSYCSTALPRWHDFLKMFVGLTQ